MKIKETEYDIPDDFDHIQVRVLTGDEVVTVFNKNGEIIAGPFDPEGPNRTFDYHDGIYTVTQEGLEEWGERWSSYDMELGPDYELMTELDALWYGLLRMEEES